MNYQIIDRSTNEAVYNSDSVRLDSYVEAKEALKCFLKEENQGLDDMDEDYINLNQFKIRGE